MSNLTYIEQRRSALRLIRLILATLQEEGLQPESARVVMEVRSTLKGVLRQLNG